MLQRRRQGERQKGNRAFSLTWPACIYKCMQIYGNKRIYLRKKRVQLPPDWFGTPTSLNMAAVSLFWNTDMAALTSCENAL